jgi:hypothetical protein
VVAARASTGLWINITKIMHLVHGCWMVYGSTSRTSYWSMFFLFPLFSSIFLEPVTSFWQSERDDSRGPTLGFQSTRQSASVTLKKIWTLLNKFPSSQVGKSIEPWARFIVFLARADWHAILIHTFPRFPNDQDQKTWAFKKDQSSWNPTRIHQLNPSKKNWEEGFFSQHPGWPAAQDELRLAGERLHYRLLRGAGPPEGASPSGWVSYPSRNSWEYHGISW